MKKILLFKIGAIGDVVMTTPLVRQLRKSFPDAQIDYAVGKPANKVLENNKYINEVISFEAKKTPSAILKFAPFISKIRKRKYDAVFMFDRHLILNSTAQLFGAKELIGFDRLGKEGVGLTHKVYFDGSKHEIQYYLELGKKYGAKIDTKDVRPDVFITKKDEKFAESIFKKYKLGKNTICIAPGGAKNPGQSISLKLWPEERYAELIEQLVKNNNIVLVGDKNDTKTGEWIINKVKSNKVVNMIDKTTIQETAALMKKSAAIICNDTGPMHIASAVNSHVISIFGPTDPNRFSPLSRGSTYIWKKKDKKPCNDIYGSFKSCEGVNYTEEVSVNDVFGAVKKVLGK